MQRKLYVIICLLMLLTSAKAQTDAQLVRDGNKLFSARRFGQAEVLYRKALDKNAGNAIAAYNLARSLQAQHKNVEAKKLYGKAVEMEKNAVRRASSYHNLGVIFQGEKTYDKAIEAYKNALRCNPAHKNARYNLELCQHLQKQNKQQSGGGENKRNDKNENKKKQPRKNNKQNAQPRSNTQKENKGMSRDNAEQLLNAAMQQERATQERLSRAMRQPSDKKLDKNW